MENIRRLLPPNLPERHRKRLEARFRLARVDPDGDQQVAEMDAAGIDVAVSLMIDFGVVFPDQVPALESVYATHRALLTRHPGRFVLFAGVDPRRGQAGLEMFERAIVEWGFKGMKLYPPCGYSPSDPGLDPFYDLCTQHNIPVLTHIGPTSPKLSFQHTRPSDVESAAFRFPKVDFILAHGAVVHRNEAALLAEYRPNIYVDTSGFQVEHRRGNWVETLAYFKQRGLVRKLLFGTDWPIHCQHGPLKMWIERLSGGGLDGPLTAAETRWIQDDNPREVLRLP